MRKMLSLGIVAAAAALAGGCGNSAGAGTNWIFYSAEESSSDGKSTTKLPLQEAINIKYVSMATYYPKGTSEKDKQTLLWMLCGSKEIRVYGSDADKIWKQMQSNN
jgi:hypothetical protein